MRVVVDGLGDRMNVCGFVPVLKYRHVDVSVQAIIAWRAGFVCGGHFHLPHHACCAGRAI